MYGINHPERIKLNNQIKEWNVNRLDLFQVSEPDDYLEFYGVMRFFYQGDDLKYQTKCLRVSSTATTQDVNEALILKFHPDLKMLNKDKYQLYESHNLEDRRMKSREHPLLVQLNWALNDKDGKFILKNESRRRRSIDMITSNSLFNYSVSNSQFTNGNDHQPQRTHSSSVSSNQTNLLKRFASLKKSRRKSKVEKDANDVKRMAEEISGKPPESSFTRTISNPDEVMKRRRQNKLEARLEQFSGVKGDGETGGTLKIYGDSINPDIPYKTLLLSVNDTAEKVLSETLDKYGLSSEDHRFYVLVQQNIPPRDDKNRGNIEEIILHDQDCPLGILVRCPPKRGSATFAIRRATPLDKHPAMPRMPPFALSKESSPSVSINQNKVHQTNRKMSSSSTMSSVEYPLLRQVFVDANGSLYDVQNGIHSLSSLVNVQRSESMPPEGSRFIKIGSQLSSVGDYPNILLSMDDFPDVRPVHCHISARLDSKASSIKLQVTPTLDTTSRTPRPCVTFVNQQRIDSSTRLAHGDVIQLADSVMFRFDEYDEETQSNNDNEHQWFDEEGDTNRISFFTADLPVTVNYNYTKSQLLVDTIMHLSTQYSQKGCKDLFGNNVKLDINNLDETYRLGPAYMMYLVLRATLGNEQKIVQITDWIADRIIQTIKEESNSVEKEIFWLSNTSELLHLLQYDNDLRHYSSAAQNVLASAIERAFSAIQHQFSKDLMILLPDLLSEDDGDIEDNTQEDNIPCLDRASVLNEHGDIEFPIQHLLQTLSLAYTLFHNCQVNIALTIQMFSQLFHLLNTWLFNAVLGDQQCDTDNYSAYPLPVCQEWGTRLSRRLNRIRCWSEINGLEMAANCHLQKMYHVAELMEADKNDLNVFGEKCIEMVNLNGAQLHQLLISCQDFNLPDAWIEVVVNTAIQLHDQEFNDKAKSKAFPQNKNTLPLFEDMDLRLPLLLPADGYCCDRGIVSCPTDLRVLLKAVKDILIYRLNPPTIDQMDTRWKSYLGVCENTPSVSRSSTVIEQSSPRTWTESHETEDNPSVSETVSVPRERYQKKTNIPLQLSLYTNSQNRSVLPITERRESSQSDNFDSSQRNDTLKNEIPNRLELKLKKINNSLGLSIIALKANVKEINRIYVKDVIPDGAGFKCGLIGVGDQLVSIDGILLENMTQDEAVALMKKTKTNVTLLIEKGAALKHGVMDVILRVRNSRLNSAAQQQSSQKKPQSRSNVTTKSPATKEEAQVKSNRSQLLLPSLPTDKGPPRPPRIQQASNATQRKVSNLDRPEENFNSLPVRKPKVTELATPDMPVYATINKKMVQNKKFDINYSSSQEFDTKPTKSISQPNLSIGALSNRTKSSSISSTASSSSSDSLSSIETELPQKPKPQLKIPSRPISLSSKTVPLQIQPKLQTRQPVKAVSESDISHKHIGVPRHEVVQSGSEARVSGPKRQIFSRPVISKSVDPIFNDSDDDDSIPLKKPINEQNQKPQRPSSSSSSENVSSNTLSTSSSDHSPQPQRKHITAPFPLAIQNDIKIQPKVELQAQHARAMPAKESLPSNTNLGSLKKPEPLSSSKSSEQLTDFSKHQSFDSPKKSPKASKQSPISKSKSYDDEILSLGSVKVNSFSPFIGMPLPPLPTASYPQYHPPEYLEENLPSVNDQFDVPKHLTEDEIKLHKKELADTIRQQTKERIKKAPVVQPKPIQVKPQTSSAVNEDKSKPRPKYGRPQFHDREQSNRSVSLYKPDTNFDFNVNDDGFRMPSPPPPLLPEGGVVIRSKVLGANEVYRETFKKNRNSEIDTKPDGVEELSFGEKMKLFAERTGEEKVASRTKFSSKQRQLESEDFT